MWFALLKTLSGTIKNLKQRTFFIKILLTKYQPVLINFTCRPSDKHDVVNCLEYTQTAFTCSKLTIDTLEQGVKYIQS